MDIDSIPPGEDFEQHIRNEIEGCDLVLVLIGDNWLDANRETGHRRIDDPNDFVRIEIESALARREVKLIPVLVEGASMPRPAELPESIRRLSRFQVLELSDQRFTADMERLASLIERLGSPGVAVSPGEEEPPRGGSKDQTVERTPGPHLPDRITKGWLSRTVPLLDGAELAALMDELTRRGWSDREIEDWALNCVDYLRPLREALRRHKWPEGEIDSFIDSFEGERPECPEADGERQSSVEVPARVTKRWIADNVPTLSKGALAELTEVLRQRKWSEGWLIDWVYPHAAWDARPLPRSAPGDPTRADLTFPKRFTDSWLRASVPTFDGDELAALIVELRSRKRTEGDIEDAVYARLT